MPKLLSLSFPDLRLEQRDAPKLRGYFAHHFGQDSILFHNHTAEGGFHYQYPEIQYKVLRGIPTVIGVNEGADRLMEVFMDINEMELDGKVVPVNTKELQMLDAAAEVTQQLQEYRFLTPYYPFTQENYRAFQVLSETEQNQRLNELLRNHLIQAMRGIGVEVSPEGNQLMVLGKLRMRMVNFKNQRMQMYLGGFTSNVVFPASLGIGKSTARGFGTVERIKR